MNTLTFIPTSNYLIYMSACVLITMTNFGSFGFPPKDFIY